MLLLCIYIAIFLMQYGDYDPNFHKPGFLAQDELLPKRVSIDFQAFITDLHRLVFNTLSPFY